MELILVAVIVSTIWVFFDSKEKTQSLQHALSWAFLCLLLWIIVFPYYLAKRNILRPLRDDEDEQTAVNPATAIAALGLIVFVFLLYLLNLVIPRTG